MSIRYLIRVVALSSTVPVLLRPSVHITPKEKHRKKRPFLIRLESKVFFGHVGERKIRVRELGRNSTVVMKHRLLWGSTGQYLRCCTNNPFNAATSRLQIYVYVYIAQFELVQSIFIHTSQVR